MNILNEYGSLTNCTDNENGDIIIIVNYLLRSIPGSVMLRFLIGLTIWTIPKPLITLNY